jgi:hypothetical protein
MRERIKTLPFPSESHDDPSPKTLTDLEREDIYTRLQQLYDLAHAIERRQDVLELSRKDSVPVTVSGKGFTLIGNWRVVVFLAVLGALVYLIPMLCFGK